MTKVKRDWEKLSPPKKARLNDIKEDEWNEQLKEYLTGKVKGTAALNELHGNEIPVMYSGEK